MELTELLGHVASVLERLKIQYAVVDSVASSFYGDVRFTNDIDIVAGVSEENVSSLLNAFPTEDYYLSGEAVREAIRNRSQFNIIHPESGLKVDIILPQSDHPAQLMRRRKVRPPDGTFDAYFAAPEDIILKKMAFFEEGGSEKHLRDIAGILRVSQDDVDRDYIARHAEEQGLSKTWQQLLKRLDDPR